MVLKRVLCKTKHLTGLIGQNTGYFACQLNNKTMERKKIINGYTDEGQPIWRWETSAEILCNELDKMEEKARIIEIYDEDCGWQRYCENCNRHLGLREYHNCPNCQRVFSSVERI